MKTIPPSSLGAMALSTVLIGVIFAIDLSVPLGFAGGIPYVVPVLICAWRSETSCIVISAAAGSVLTILGYVFSPEGGVYWVVIANRGLALIVIWTTAYVAYRERRSRHLRELREQYIDGVLTNIADAVVTIDRTGKIETVNASAEQMFGYEEIEIIGRNVNFLMPQPYQGEHDDYLRNYLVTGNGKILDVSSRELTAKKKDGSVFPIELTVGKTNAGGRQKFIGSIRDISKRKEMESALRESEERFRRVFEEGPLGMALIARDTRFLAANQSLCRMLGYTENELKGHSISEFTHPDDVGKDIELAAKIVRDDIPSFSLEKRYIKKTGEVIWANLFGSLLSSADGGTAYGLGMVEDITERKRVENELRLTQFTLDHGSDAAFWVGENGGFQYVNQSGRRMLGYSWDELSAMNIWDVDPDVRQADWPRIWAGIESRGDRHTFEAVHLAKDGRKIPVEVTTTQVKFDDRKIFCSFSRDITERKQTEDQLRHAQKMETVGQLTGGIAHEFNNLLTVVVGNIELLQAQLPDDDRLRQFTSPAMKGALRGAALTQSLLAFSRKQTLNMADVDLNDILVSMRLLLQRTLGEPITFECELSEDLWKTIADANQIEAATLNLALNARDAMPKGGTIIVRTHNRTLDAEAAVAFDTEPGEFVVLEVADAGTGMTAETVEHAFEPFFTTKEVGKGTGLGLSMVYGFAKQSGGFVDIESEVGRGTTVRMYLPRAREQEAVIQKEVATPRPLKEGKGTILVVEDDPEVMNVVTNLLDGLGYGIVEAGDGETALATMDERDDLDLLFTDVVLKGGMSGPDVAREARRRRPGFKVIFTSGHPLGSIEGIVLDDEEPVIVRKPYQRAELAEKLAAVLET